MYYFDLHCDTLYELWKNGGQLSQAPGQLSLHLTDGFTHYAQWFALWCGVNPIAPGQGRARLDAMLKTAKRQWEKCRGQLLFCRSAGDLRNSRRQNKCAAFLAIEGAELLDGPEDAVDAARQGVRMVGMTWNHRNQYACPSAVDQEEGLSQEGQRLVSALEEQGILIDVSHLSRRGFWDLTQCAKRPLVATHSNSDSICSHHRNLTNQQFSHMVRTGGLVGLNFYVPFLTAGLTATVDHLVAHLEHFLSLGGENTVAIGADWDGCDRLPEEIRTIADVSVFRERLLQLNYSEDLIHRLFYQNAADFLQKNLQ